MPSTTASVVVSLVTLTALEIVLGIDNIVFISLLSGKARPGDRARARQYGLGLAVITRVLLLISIKWLIGLTQPFGHVLQYEVSGKALILLGGGLFLIYKSVKEIYEKVESHEESELRTNASAFWAVVTQILIVDIVFSLDSVITAVGMANDLPVMIAAVIIALGIMLVFSNWVSGFVERHPSIKVLALSFLILIGANLVGEALGQHIEKGFTYFAMAFATGVEVLNIRMRKRARIIDSGESDDDGASD